MKKRLLIVMLVAASAVTAAANILYMDDAHDRAMVEMCLLSYPDDSVGLFNCVARI